MAPKTPTHWLAVGSDTFVISGTEAQSDSFAGGTGTDTIQITGSGTVTVAGSNT